MSGSNLSSASTQIKVLKKYTWFQLRFFNMGFDFGLALSAFLAGMLIFLAPCTLPLVPAYLSFMSGVSFGEKSREARRKVLRSALLYILGFTVTFIILGTAAGLGGELLFAYRRDLLVIGGILLILFGFGLLGAWQLPIFRPARSISRFLTPESPWSAAAFGVVFALGWTPCAGPILGAVLTLAAVKGTALQGGLLLAIFSLGLAVPFLLLALTLHKARKLTHVAEWSKVLSVVAGFILILIGLLILANRWDWWLANFSFGVPYRFFLDYL